MSGIIFGDTVVLNDGKYLQHQIDPNAEYGWDETLNLGNRAFREWLFTQFGNVEDGSYYFDGRPRIDDKLPPWAVPAAEEWLQKRWSFLRAWKGAGFSLELGKMVWNDTPCNCPSAETAHRATCRGGREPKQKGVDSLLQMRLVNTIQNRPWVRRFILIAGDYDYFSVVQYAHEWGREVILVHGSYDVSEELHDEADQTFELSREWLLAAPFVSVVSRQTPIAAR